MSNHEAREFIDYIIESSNISEELKANPLFIAAGGEKIHEEYTSAIKRVKEVVFHDEISTEICLVLLWSVLLRAPNIAAFINKTWSEEAIENEIKNRRS